MSYYLKKRITDILISIVMLLFLALTLLPIVWMVYSSLKDSTDIAIGKIGLRRAGTDVVVIQPATDNNIMVLAADGSLNLLNKNDLKMMRHVSYKTTASAYLLDNNYIWLASANRGLIRIDRTDWKKSQSFSLPVWGIDFNKVTNVYLKKDGVNLYLTFDFKGFDDVLDFDTTVNKFMKLIKGGRRHHFLGVAPVASQRFAGIDDEVFTTLKEGNLLYLGTSSGKIYRYDPTKQAILTQTKLPTGHILVRWNNYIDMWRNVNFGLYLRNSLIICGFTMLLAMIFSTMAAYALSRFRFPGADFFSNAVLATQMIPAIMYLIPIYIMFVKFTLLSGIPVKGTFLGIILIYTAFFIPFSIWILRGFFAAIPKELEEAALIDGCSRFKVFWYVVLPLAIPGIIATGIYVFLTAWDELMFAWVLTNADTMTIPVGIRLFVGNYQNRFDLMMAAATIATVPVVVLFFMLQRHIVRGLTAGAVKG
jgi:multiple sugar transport system permease protein